LRLRGRQETLTAEAAEDSGGVRGEIQAGSSPSSPKRGSCGDRPNQTRHFPLQSGVL